MTVLRPLGDKVFLRKRAFPAVSPFWRTGPCAVLGRHGPGANSFSPCRSLAPRSSQRARRRHPRGRRALRPVPRKFPALCTALARVSRLVQVPASKSTLPGGARGRGRFHPQKRLSPAGKPFFIRLFRALGRRGAFYPRLPPNGGNGYSSMPARACASPSSASVSCSVRASKTSLMNAARSASPFLTAATLPLLSYTMPMSCMTRSSCTAA